MSWPADMTAEQPSGSDAIARNLRRILLVTSRDWGVMGVSHPGQDAANLDPAYSFLEYQSLKSVVLGSFMFA